MLAKLRSRKVYLYGTIVIVFAFLVKMLVPVVHANNLNSNNPPSFLASLCTANGVVLIDSNASAGDDSKQTPVVNAGSQCLLCSIEEHNVFDLKVTATVSIFESGKNKYDAIAFTLIGRFLPQQLSIRAPPF